MRTIAAVCLIVLLPSLGLGADLASVVSEDAILFAEITNPKGMWADFEQSGLRDMVRGMPNGELQFRLAAGFVQQIALQQLGIRLGEFFGTYAPRLAIVLPEVPGGAQPIPCLLLDVSETKDAMKNLLRNTVERTLQARNPNAKVADDVHHGVAIRLLPVGGRNAAYAFLDDILVLGTQDGVKKLIEGRRGSRPRTRR
ncbi:hypothetical protein ACFL09_02800, partial [Planctomycetota bacterium]